MASGAQKKGAEIGPYESALLMTFSVHINLTACCQHLFEVYHTIAFSGI